MTDNNLSMRARGAGYEAYARRYLEKAGLVFVVANFTCRGGELDLIMRDQQTWVFVEVRYRRNTLFGDAAASVTIPKQRRLLRTASFWLAGHNASFDTSSCRFDVLAITGNHVEWLPNAFNADGCYEN